MALRNRRPYSRQRIFACVDHVLRLESVTVLPGNRMEVLAPTGAAPGDRVWVVRGDGPVFLEGSFSVESQKEAEGGVLLEGPVLERVSPAARIDNEEGFADFVRQLNLEGLSAIPAGFNGFLPSLVPKLRAVSEAPKDVEETVVLPNFGDRDMFKRRIEGTFPDAKMEANGDTITIRMPAPKNWEKTWEEFMLRAKRDGMRFA